MCFVASEKCMISNTMQIAASIVFVIVIILIVKVPVGRRGWLT